MSLSPHFYSILYNQMYNYSNKFMISYNSILCDGIVYTHSLLNISIFEFLRNYTPGHDMNRASDYEKLNFLTFILTISSSFTITFTQ